MNLHCEGTVNPEIQIYQDREGELDDNGVINFHIDQWFIRPDSFNGAFLDNLSNNRMEREVKVTFTLFLMSGSKDEE